MEVSISIVQDASSSPSLSLFIQRLSFFWPFPAVSVVILLPISILNPFTDQTLFPTTTKTIVFFCRNRNSIRLGVLSWIGWNGWDKRWISLNEVRILIFFHSHTNQKQRQSTRTTTTIATYYTLLSCQTVLHNPIYSFLHSLTHSIILVVVVGSFLLGVYSLYYVRMCMEHWVT
jgi:hypothetical protein